jgi:hypothetical protein
MDGPLNTQQWMRNAMYPYRLSGPVPNISVTQRGTMACDEDFMILNDPHSFTTGYLIWGYGKDMAKLGLPGRVHPG